MAGAVLHQRSWVGACAKSSLCPWDEMFVCREALSGGPLPNPGTEAVEGFGTASANRRVTVPVGDV